MRTKKWMQPCGPLTEATRISSLWCWGRWNHQLVCTGCHQGAHSFLGRGYHLVCHLHCGAMTTWYIYMYPTSVTQCSLVHWHTQTHSGYTHRSSICKGAQSGDDVVNSTAQRSHNILKCEHQVSLTTLVDFIALAPLWHQSAAHWHCSATPLGTCWHQGVVTDIIVWSLTSQCGHWYCRVVTDIVVWSLIS